MQFQEKYSIIYRFILYFRNKKVFEEHKTKEHGVRKNEKETDPLFVDENIKCDFCDEIFENEFAMKRHRKSNTHELKFKCPLCPMAFIQLPIMENHLKLGIYWVYDKKIAY